MKYLLPIIGLLLGIYLLYALGQTIGCYVTVRFSHEAFDTERSEIWTECKERHLLFPLYL